MIEFRLLGPLEVRADGGPVPLRGLKQRALLTLLLLRANRVVARERLIDELWGDEPPETAVKAVQVYVSQLRTLLPPGMIVTRAPGYVLELEPGALDLLRFEQLMLKARDAEPAVAARLLREALELWRGPPLADFANEPFARAEARRLDDLRLAALEQRIDAELAVGLHADLVGELEVLVAEHPHREHLRRQQMLALYRSGRQADALAAFGAARDALDDLGIEPSAVLRRLERQILTQDAALDLEREAPAALVTEVVLPGPLVPAPRSPFVGRVCELELLRSLLDRAEAGEGAFAILGGEAGSGKTRLVRELAHVAAARGTLVLYGASDATVSTPYRPLRDWLDFLLRVGDDGALAECLAGADPLVAQLLPELARFVGAPARHAGEPEPYLLQSAAVEFLRRASRIQPLLLIADDLHWADEETLNLLRRLARRAPEARLLAVGAARTHGEEVSRPLSETLADLSRLEGVARITLGAFSADEVRTFVKASTEVDAPSELTSALGSMTGGSPLLLSELWRELVESGAVEVSTERVRLVRPLAALGRSDRISDVVQQRLSRLTPETSTMLELAATTGSHVELRVLAGAAGLEPAELATAVDEAVRTGLIEELPGVLPTYRFTHELVRRAVYDRIDGIRRMELHLRVGEALERVYATDPARVLPELAHHFTLAASLGDAERAVEYNLRAGEAALAAWVSGEAISRYETALELGIADPRERARIQIELATLLRAAGRLAESRALLAASLEAPTGSLERTEAEQAHIVNEHAAAVRMESPMGDPAADPQLYWSNHESAVEAFVELGDWRRAALAGRELGKAGRRAGRLGDACAALEQALAHAERSGDRNAHREPAVTLSYALCDGPTPVYEATRRCEELARGDPAEGFQAIINRALSLLYAMDGRADAAHELLSRWEPVLERGVIGLAHSWVYRVITAQVKELLGDRAGAEQALIDKWHFFRDLGDFRIDARAMHSAYHLALIYCDDERWEEAEECVAFGAEMPVPGYFLHEAVLGLAARARVAAYRGDLERGEALGRQAIGLVEQSDFLNLQAVCQRALAEVLRRSGDELGADAATAAARERYERKGNVAAASALLA